MNGYLLDTNIISDMIRNPDGLAAQRVRQIESQKIFTSIIVAAELRYGCEKKDSPKLKARVNRLLEILPVLPFEIPTDSRYGSIRSKLELAGQPIGSNDLLIAAHAHALGLTLVTDNTREFNRVPDLRVENWLKNPPEDRAW